MPALPQTVIQVYKQILSGCSLGCKNALNFACLTMKFHNRVHTTVHICKISLPVKNLQHWVFSSQLILNFFIKSLLGSFIWTFDLGSSLRVSHLILINFPNRSTVFLLNFPFSFKVPLTKIYRSNIR